MDQEPEPEAMTTSSSSESDQSLDGSYYRVNPAPFSPDTESVNMLMTDRQESTTTTAYDEESTKAPNSLDHQFTSLTSARPLSRNDSISSVSSSIIFAPEDFQAPAKKAGGSGQELRDTLENLDSRNRVFNLTAV